MNATRISNTKQEIMDWIGGHNEIIELSDEKAEKLLSWLKDNNINIENSEDMDKASDYVATLL